ncbi:MAG: hypothetical protein GX256_03965 [Fretibacterium sp.]|nr:hypothetical protein [Fretibacterium sp.]
MTAKANGEEKARLGGDFASITRDDKKKLAELQAMILAKGSEDRDRLLEEAQKQSQDWLAKRTAELNETVENIRNDALLRAQEISARQLMEAEASNNKERLRLQSDLVLQALDLLRKELTALSDRPDYDAILTGLAAEVCEKLSSGRIGLRLNEQDAPLGLDVVGALNARFKNLIFYFDEKPEPISGGVVLFSEEERWRVSADWNTKVEGMTEAVAAAVLKEL